LLKDSLDLIIKSSKNNFVIKNNFGTFLVIFLEVVKNEAEKSVKIGQIVVKLQTMEVSKVYTRTNMQPSFLMLTIFKSKIK